MDRRVLSDPTGVAASRDFICARLLTYESAEEGKFLESICPTRSGQLENTVFGFLAPDGVTPLTRMGRGPEHLFQGSSEETGRTMAAAMKEMSAKSPGDSTIARQIPYLVDLRRGLNVAACDLLPLVVVAAQTPESRRKFEEALAPLAWKSNFVGRFEYAAVTDSTEVQKLEGATSPEGIFVVEPDAYGQKVKVLSQSSSSNSADLEKALDAGLKKFVPKSKDSRAHIEAGRRAGVYWKTEIPVTDPHGPPEGRR